MLYIDAVSWTSILVCFVILPVNHHQLLIDNQLQNSPPFSACIFVDIEVYVQFISMVPTFRFCMQTLTVNQYNSLTDWTHGYLLRTETH